MRVGVIGLGSAGMRHARNLVDEGVKQLVLVDQVGALDKARGAFNPDTLQRITWSTDDNAEACIQEEVVDAWMICTPWDQHHDLARLALKHCDAVFVEKPLCATVENALHLVNDGAGKVTQVGYNWRFHPDLQSFDPGPLTIWAYRGDMSSWPGKSYGPAWLECSHEVDMALWKNGPAATIERTLTPQGGRIEILHVNNQRSIVSIQIDSKQEMRGAWTSPGHAWTGWDTSQDAIDQTYVLELRHFLAHVAARQETEVPFSCGVEVLKIIEESS